MQKPSLPMNAPIQIPEEGAFRAWLEREHDIHGRSIGDICSRVRRTMGMISIKPNFSDAEVESALLLSTDFQKCTMSVKSQLRRSAKLYRTYIASRMNKKK